MGVDFPSMPRYALRPVIRKGLERLLRYCARPIFWEALDRARTQMTSYQPRDGPAMKPAPALRRPRWHLCYGFYFLIVHYFNNL